MKLLVVDDDRYASEGILSSLPLEDKESTGMTPGEYRERKV